MIRYVWFSNQLKPCIYERHNANMVFYNVMGAR